MPSEYDVKVRNFRELNACARKGEIVFVGSSLCEFFPICELLQNVEPRIRVYNRGIAGDVTEGLLARMEESVFALEPRKVFINIGTNGTDMGARRCWTTTAGFWSRSAAVCPRAGSMCSATIP